MPEFEAFFIGVKFVSSFELSRRILAISHCSNLLAKNKKATRISGGFVMGGREKPEFVYDRLQNALKHCNGKLILCAGTEHNHTLWHLLFHGLRLYARKRDWEDLPSVPKNAVWRNDHEYWDTDLANQLIGNIVYRLRMITPAGWDFRTPIYGIVLEYGWFSIKMFPIKNQKRNSVWE